MLESGYEIVNGFMSNHWINQIIKDIETKTSLISETGIRNAEKKFPSVASYLNDKEFSDATRPYFNSEYDLVRAIVFIKTPEINWYVTWHQDRTVTVSNRIAESGWGPWSIKDGVHHVQPPSVVLESMVTVRIHLDKADKENGCLKVIPFSHKLGIMKQNSIAGFVKESEVIDCEVEKGGALLMRPLLLHTSSKASQPHNRRVLHLEFCNYNLPEGLDWS